MLLSIRRHERFYLSKSQNSTVELHVRESCIVRRKDTAMSEFWERQEGEPLIWYSRFRRYLLLFPKRTVAAVYATESGPKEDDNGKQRKSEPSGYWYDIAKQWHWEDRAQAWDAAQYAEEEQSRKRILQSGWALDHNRIMTLIEVTQALREMMNDPSQVWLADVKAVGSGPGAERVDLVQFNADLFRELREYLTDIAEETGGRAKKQETTIKGLPKVYVDLSPDEDGSEP